MRKALLLLVVAAILVLGLGSAAWAADGDAILGKWKVGSGKAIVQMYEYQGKYFGKMVWLKEPKNEDGTEKLDAMNPDPEKKKRKLMGLNIVYGLEFKGDNKYEGGQIYAADDGKLYKVKATVKGDTMDMRGYVGVSLFGRTDVWTRVK